MENPKYIVISDEDPVDSNFFDNVRDLKDFLSEKEEEYEGTTGTVDDDFTVFNIQTRKTVKIEVRRDVEIILIGN